jgi:hypothetical protein
MTKAKKENILCRIIQKNLRLKSDLQVESAAFCISVASSTGGGGGGGLRE